MRAKALYQRIVTMGPMDLCAAEYRALSRLGFSRADVRRAVDHLLDFGMIEIAAGKNGAIWLRASKREVA
jgi:DNA-binding FadR family transcriptional regulator